MPTRKGLEAVPVLEGWLSLTQIADLFGVTRESIYKQAAKGTYKTIHLLGSIYIVKTQEVEELLDLRAQRLRSKTSATSA